MRFPLSAALLAAASASVAGAASAQAGTPCSGGVVFDDGTANTSHPPSGVYLGPGSPSFVSRFVPSSGPFHYDRLCIALEDRVGGTGESFEVVVHDDDNPFFPGEPGTLLASVPVTLDLGALDWVSVDLGCVVVNGPVWMGVRWVNAGDLGVGADTDGANPWRFSMDSAFWSQQWGPAALLIRAEGAPGSGLARATQRNGSGVNDLCFVAQPPRIGTTWTAQVSHSPAATVSILQVRLLPASGPIIGAGELLVDLSSARLFTRLQPSTGTLDWYAQAVPAEPGLIGFSVASQAAVREPSGFRLCNAYDLVVGCR
jgi:hypothetical protein